MTKNLEQLSERLKQALATFDKGEVASSERLLAELYPSLEAHKKERAQCCLYLSYIFFNQTRYDEALDKNLEAYGLKHFLPNAEQTYLLNNLAIIYDTIGERHKGLKYTLKALELAQNIGQQRSIFEIFNNLGYNLLIQGEPKRALENFKKAEAYTNEEPRRTALLLRNRSQAYIDIEKLELAQDHAEKALRLAKQVNDMQIEGYAFYSLAQIARKRQQWPQAINLYKKVLKQKYCTGEAIPFSYLEIAECYRLQGHFKAAIQHLEEALKQLHAQPQKFPLLRCYEALFLIYEESGDIANALSYHKQLHALHKDIYNEQNEMKIRVLEVEHRTDMLKQEADLLKQKNQELEYLNKTVKELSVRDELTGLYNRRYLVEQSDVLCKAALRYKRALSVAVLDIDYFKRVNDSFGHKVGDDVIRQVAQLLTLTLREADLVARYGGEEFVVFLPETPLENALIACERLRHAIEIYDWTQIHSGLNISISIGVAVQRTNENSETLINLADEQLYQAKHLGRNRVCCALMPATLADVAL